MRTLTLTKAPANLLILRQIKVTKPMLPFTLTKAPAEALITNKSNIINANSYFD